MLKKFYGLVLILLFVFSLSGCTFSQEKNKSQALEGAQVAETESKPTTEITSREVAVGGEKTIVSNSDSIKIIYPAANTELKVGDTLNIKVNISDFENLVSFMLFFQGQTIFVKPTSPVMEYKFIVNGENIENQNIVALGNFSDGENKFQSEDSKLIKITPVESIKDFNIKPEVIMIEKGKSRRPDYEAIFPTAISAIGETDLFKVSIKDPNLLLYDNKTNYFMALNQGETMATVTYRGITKNVFFNIIQYEKPPVD